MQATIRDVWVRILKPAASPGKAIPGLAPGAGTLARQLGGRDYDRSKVALAELRVACNHCHQTFRVPVKVAPQAAPGARDAE